MNNTQIIDERRILGQEFKIYGDFENPLFLAKDVAEWIEHNKPSEMIQNIDDDEKLKAIISLAGQNREMWFLTEDGLYEVLMQSRKPIAKAFKKEVKKILKEIRLKGYYIPNTYDKFYLNGVEVYTSKQIADMTNFPQYYVDEAINSINPPCLYLQGPDLRRFENENGKRNPYGRLGYPTTVHSRKTMLEVKEKLCGEEYSSTVKYFLERIYE
ncbi:MAG: Bro-N domain-containing protein [Eubacteriales bacterium]|nr:Bro-N domain-containing protein [Eubacteriales bacterium]